jgi:hypothetical protein
VYENQMLGGIFGPKREEVAGGWSFTKYYLGGQIREDELRKA